MAGGLAEQQAAPGAQQAGRMAALLDRIWLALRRSWLLALAATLLLVLLLIARAVPQVPGQYAEDPAAAQRWLNAEIDRWGSLGAAMGQLGLYNVGASPLFFVALVLVALLALVHLADALRAMRAIRSLPADMASAPVGLPVDLTGWPDPLYRRRIATAFPPDALLPDVETLLASRFSAPERHDVGEAGAPAESRLLAQRRPWSVWLRVLLPLGLLMGSLGVWANSIWGWSVSPPELAPADAFTLEERDLAVEYAPVSGGATVDAPLVVRRGEREAGIMLDGHGSLPGISARSASGSPALLLTTRDAVLARPNDVESRSAVGLLFPQVGSEQVVVLPQVGAGIRVVRLAATVEPRYLIELFAPDAVEPVGRVEITGTRALTLPAGSSSVSLQIMPTYGAQVAIERRPVAWLPYLGLALALLGMLGWLLPAGFAIVQVRPWLIGRSELTIQTTEAGLVAPVIGQEE